MALEIRSYDESLLGEMIDIFNRETKTGPFVVPLTAELVQERITSKAVFEPEGTFLLFDGSRAVGLALTCQGVSDDRSKPDPGIGVIDGLFFPEEDLRPGEHLLERCLLHLGSRGVRKIYGFASFGGYPFWRGLYCGAEPVCLTDYRQTWIAFMAHGFAHHQQSLNYLGATEPQPHRSDLSYRVSELDLSTSWARMSWKGLIPRVLTAEKDGTVLGRIGYVELPELSEYRDTPTGGIYSMNVDPSARRQGIGSSLIGALFDHARATGTKEILVGTTVENTAARRTYEKAGMRGVGFRTGTNLTIEKK